MASDPQIWYEGVNTIVDFRYDIEIEKKAPTDQL